VIFRQLFDASTSTFTYLLADEHDAVLIDTVFEQHLRDLALLRELDLRLLYTLETHVHADHVTGAWLMKRATDSKIGVSKRSGVQGADIVVVHGDKLRCGSLSIEVRETPGHTDGCVTYVLQDECMAFTGDALLIRGAGRTDFQQGDPARLYHSVREQIFVLPRECKLYPAHDYEGRSMTTVAEERAHNPRLGDRVREQDFVGYMNNLGLPHPKRMAAAVPANLACGRPRDPADIPRTPDWGPAIRTFAGVWEMGGDWLYQHLDDVHVIDVREHAEIAASPIPGLRGARVIPLSEIRDRIAEVPRDRPVILVCPAGARSASAATILEKAGIEKVANLRGGLIEWCLLGYAT